MSIIRKSANIVNLQPISSDSELTPDAFGYVKLYGTLMQAGMMTYTKKELFGTDIPKIVNEMFPGSQKVELWIEADTLDTYTVAHGFNGKALTLNHPKDFVDSDNHNKHAQGVVYNVNVYDESLRSEISVYGKKVISLIDDVTSIELSASYYSDLDLDDDGRIYQRNIIPNHVALVPRGRCGKGCSVNFPINNADNADTKGKPMKIKLSNGSTVDIDDDATAQLVKASVDAVTSELSTVSGENAALKVQLANAEKNKLDADEIEKRVEARNAITRYLPENTDTKGKSDADLMVTVIENAGHKVDDKASVDFLTGMFNIVTAGKPIKNSNVTTRTPANNTTNLDNDGYETGVTHEEAMWERTYGKKGGKV